MASSHRMGIRGLLIAAFLVMAPLMAIFQGPLQDRIQTLLRRDPPKQVAMASAESSAEFSETAPGFRPVVRGDKQDDDAPATNIAARRPRFPDELEDPPPKGDVERRRRPDDPRQARLDRGTQEAESPSASDDGPIAQRRPAQKGDGTIATEYEERPSASNPFDRPRTTHMTDRKQASSDREDSRDLSIAVDDVMEKAGGAPKAAKSSSDPLTRPYTRLRDLGATATHLETWGAESDRYRFQCRIALDADATETQHFEATDAQPLRAIEKVVQQVESWQSQRR